LYKKYEKDKPMSFKVIIGEGALRYDGNPKTTQPFENPIK
jgi:hypothetical protein